MALDDPDSKPGPQSPGVDPRLLELLVCPLTKTRLEYDAVRQELISRAAGLAFPIRNGVPLLIADAARHLNDNDHA
ncbi:MAG TPA: Trm112 family protein [Hyphomicrobium sp.]|nr:Trm112 family protein [Hyphomicrobium sp.]